MLVAQLCLTLCDPQTVACQGPLSMGFSRQEYWSGLPFPSPGDLPNPGTKLASPALAGSFFTTEPHWGEWKWKSCSVMSDSATSWTVAHQAPVHEIFQARILEWVAIAFSRGSSQPRDGTRVSCIASRRFTVWATREVYGIYGRGLKSKTLRAY